jgi:hypothetical protein
MHLSTHPIRRVRESRGRRVAPEKAMSDFETVYLVGGPRDNEMLTVATGGMVATVTRPGGTAAMHAVGSEQERYEYSRSALPDGWPSVFAFTSDAHDPWPVERVMDKLTYRGKAPPWRSRRGG